LEAGTTMYVSFWCLHSQGNEPSVFRSTFGKSARMSRPREKPCSHIRDQF
jgi:hypothetical protein